MIERTVAIIKPDVVRQKQVGDIIGEIEMTSGLTIIKMAWMHFTRNLASEFYIEHRGKHHFDGLVEHTASGPCVSLILEGEDAILKWRQMMGPTNPNKEGATGLRARYGTGMPQNAVHGSDSAEAARREIELLFVAATSKVSFKKLDPAAILPTRATTGSSGYDLYALEGGEAGFGKITRVRTGLSIELPEGMEGQVRPRSGLAAKYGVTVVNSPGTIDSDFRGELCVILTQHKDWNPFEFEAGDRIAQLVFSGYETPDLIEVDGLSSTTRGAGGFGHTGT